MLANIFAEFMLHTGEKARNMFLRLFNQIWNETDAVPYMWEKATTIPLLKKDKSAFDFNGKKGNKMLEWFKKRSVFIK